VAVTATDNVMLADQIQFAFSLDSETTYGSYAAASTVSYDVATDRPHVIRVKAREQIGNESAPLVVTVRADTVAPTITLTAPASGFLTNQPQASETGTVTDGSV